jgi:purine-binding chemotaxis protein CheW
MVNGVNGAKRLLTLVLIHLIFYNQNNQRIILMEIAEKNEDIEQVSEGLNTEKFLVFSLFDKFYTFPSRFIGEITIFDTIYPLPLMPSYVLGVINRYSVPYALFDIGLLLFNKQGPQGKVLVIKDSIDRIAFLIEDVAGIIDVPEEQIINIERSGDSGASPDLISASFKWSGSDVFVLDIMRILDRAASEAV